MQWVICCDIELLCSSVRLATACGSDSAKTVHPNTTSLPSLQIRCFGVFCGLVVICDWILTVTVLPALVILYTIYLAPTSKPSGLLSSVLMTPMLPLQLRVVKISLGNPQPNSNPNPTQPTA